MHRLLKSLQLCWAYLREMSGENNYARYLARVRHEGGDPMTAEQYYLAELEHKHSRINRCC